MLHPDNGTEFGNINPFSFQELGEDMVPFNFVLLLLNPFSTSNTTVGTFLRKLQQFNKNNTFN